ncbi:MAG: hypothetical protein ACW96U_03055 [Candidatus Heimdallarchaeaceae archaeon]|jgi:hypothetical protein
MISTNMKIKKSILSGICFLIILMLLTTKLEAHHFGNSVTKDTSEGSNYTLTVLVDTTETEIYSNYTVFIELLINQFGSETVGFTNIKLHAKLEGGAYLITNIILVSDIEYESTGSNAGFIFNISINVASQFSVFGRAEFHENITGTDIGEYTDSGWFEGHTVNVKAEKTNFTSIFFIITSLLVSTQIWRMLRRNKRP